MFIKRLFLALCILFSSQAFAVDRATIDKVDRLVLEIQENYRIEIDAVMTTPLGELAISQLIANQGLTSEDFGKLGIRFNENTFNYDAVLGTIEGLNSVLASMTASEKTYFEGTTISFYPKGPLYIGAQSGLLELDGANYGSMIFRQFGGKRAIEDNIYSFQTVLDLYRQSQQKIVELKQLGTQVHIAEEIREPFFINRALGLVIERIKTGQTTPPSTFRISLVVSEEGWNGCEQPNNELNCTISISSPGEYSRILFGTRRVLTFLTPKRTDPNDPLSFLDE